MADSAIHVERHQAEQLIVRAAGLDPITVYLRDTGPGRGTITIACFGCAWTTGWGAMGTETVAQFVATAHVDYLLGCFLNRQYPSLSKRARADEEVYLAKIIAAVQRALATPMLDVTNLDSTGVTLIPLAKMAPPPPDDELGRDSSVLAVLIAELRQREALGRRKYGTDLDRTDLSAADLRQHLREELMDALMYSHAFDRAAARAAVPEPTYQQIFNAIQAATTLEWGGTAIGISVEKFRAELSAAPTLAGKEKG